MSANQKQNFDTIFKIFLAGAIGFFGWLGTRTVNQFDAVQTSVQAIEIKMGSVKTDIEWLKEEVNKKRNDNH